MAAKTGAVKGSSSSPQVASPTPKPGGSTVDLFGHAVRVDTLLLVGASLVGALIVVKFARPGGPAGTVAGVSFGQPLSLGSGSVQNTPGVPNAAPPPVLAAPPGGAGPPPLPPPPILPTPTGTPPTTPVAGPGLSYNTGYAGLIASRIASWATMRPYQGASAAPGVGPQASAAPGVGPQVVSRGIWTNATPAGTLWSQTMAPILGYAPNPSTNAGITFYPVGYAGPITGYSNGKPYLDPSVGPQR